MSEFNVEEFHQKVITSMEHKLAYYNMLAKYTKKTVKLHEHKVNAKLMEETIAETKQEYGLI